MFEVVSLTVVVAFGINLVTSYAADKLGASSFWTLGIGGCAVLLPLIYLISKLRNSLRTSTVAEAVVAYDIMKNELVEIPGYHFSEKVKRTLRALLVENQAFQKMWNENPLVSPDTVLQFPTGATKSGEPPIVSYSAIYERVNSVSEPTPATKLITEAMEYHVIELISDHLSEYFSTQDTTTDEIKELTGSDIPNILLTNRFLKMFTTPLEERAIYNLANIPPANPEGGVLKYISGSDGTIFTTLSLWLPRDTTITRPNGNTNGALHFKSKRANIAILVEFVRERKILRNHFTELYIGKNSKKVLLLTAKISVEISVPLTSLLSISGWSSYKWPDSIPSKIESIFNFENFLNKINWDQARTQARVSNILKRIDENVQSTESNNIKN